MTTFASESPARGPEGPGPEQRRRGSLLRSEVHRLLARRFIRLLVVLGVVGYLIGCSIAFTQFSKPTPEVLAEARAEMAAQMRIIDQYREECLANPNIAEVECGPPASEQQFEVEWFIDTQPFTLRDHLPAGAIGVGVGAAALAFLIGATYVGAEWSSRSMVALLFWEPRRGRVMAVKTAVITLAALLLGLGAQVVWRGVAELLARTRGHSDDLPPDFLRDTLALQGRSVLLVVIAALLGFGLANLIRNTGAALGIAFVYFAVVETAVGALRPRWAEYLVGDNVIALLTPGGHTLYLNEGYADEFGNYVSTGRELVMSNAHGGVTLSVYCLVVLVVGVVLFRRRDLH